MTGVADANKVIGASGVKHLCGPELSFGIYALGFVRDLGSWSLMLQSSAFGLIGLMLLLLPVTRRYFSCHAAVVDPQRRVN